jgi:ABC-2 type transport system permease protein
LKLTAVWALIRNDLRIYATDRRAMIIGILVPILIAAFFGYVFGGNGNGNTEAAKIPIAIVDEDQSPISRAIAADLGQESLVTVRTLDRPQAEAQVRAGKIQVAAVMPPDFAANASSALYSDQKRPQVELLIDPSQAMSGRVVEGLLVRSVIREITRAAAQAAQAAQAPQAASGPGMAREFTVPYTVATIGMTSGDGVPYNGYAHSFAGMTTQFILLSGVDAGIVLLLLRERGIWQRLRAAPLNKAQFLMAKVSATILISMFQFVLIYAVAILVFRVRVDGSAAGLAGLGVALCFMNSTFGLMLASVGRSAAATRGIAVMATLLLVMIGGAWVPSFVFPKWLQQASLAAPTRWAVDGLDAVTWRGQGLHAAIAPITVLGATAIICLGIAIWRFRWED